MPLKVIIIGAGVAGLTAAVSLRRAGHQVTILERSAFATEVGAALNLAPNGTSVLERLGFDKERARAVQMMNWDTVNGVTLDRIICQDVSKARERFGAPFVAIHRVDLHEELMHLAAVNKPEGVILRLSSPVTHVRPDEGEVELEDGSIEKADLIIGADGLHSIARPAVVPLSTQSSGLSAFRFLVPTEVLESNAAGNELLEWKTPGATMFVDPGSVALDQERHLMWYPCRSGDVQNFVGIHPTVAGPQPDTSEGFKAQMLSEFGHFEPRVVEMLKLGEVVKCWPLFQTEPLPTWTRGKLLLIGDAAHPMLPFGGQGSNQAIEDGGAIGFLLENVNDASQVPQCLDLFDQVRRRRASRVQILSSVRANREGLVADKLALFEEEDARIPNNMAMRVAHDCGFDVYAKCQALLQTVAQQ